MIRSWFETEERIEALNTAAAEWEHTPFMENSAVKGPRGGVSCHFLAAAIYKAVGFLPAEFKAPRGSARNLLHGPAHAMLDYVDAQMSGHFVEVDGEPEPGDMIMLKEGRVIKHVGIVLSGRRFVHVLRMIGVRISHLDDATYAGKISHVRRPRT